MTQTYIHHVLAIGGSIGSIYMGLQFPQLCVVSYITEISTPFMNYRTMLIVQGKGKGMLFNLNMYSFGLLFLVFRVLFYPFTIYRLIYGYKLIPASYPAYKYYISIILTMMYTSLYFLQLLWFYKIIISIKKQGKREAAATKKD